MTKVADIERIRWAHFREGVSIRELAMTFHKGRNTIRRALQDPGPWEYRLATPRGNPVMDSVGALVTRWLRARLPRRRIDRAPVGAQTPGGGNRGGDHPLGS